MTSNLTRLDDLWTGGWTTISPFLNKDLGTPSNPVQPSSVKDHVFAGKTAEQQMAQQQI